MIVWWLKNVVGIRDGPRVTRDHWINPLIPRIWNISSFNFFMSTRFLKDNINGVSIPQFQLAYIRDTIHTSHKKLVKLCCDHLNGGEISPGELCCGGLWDQIIMDIFVTCEKRHGVRVRGSGEASSGNLLPRLFFGKYKYFSPVVVTLSTMPVKKGGLGLQDLVTSSNDK